MFTCKPKVGFTHQMKPMAQLTQPKSEVYVDFEAYQMGDFSIHTKTRVVVKPSWILFWKGEINQTT
jgi:hypothetical protein